MTHNVTIDTIIGYLEKEQRHMENAALSYDANTAGYLKYSERAEIYKEAGKIVRCQQKRRQTEGEASQ